MIPQSTTEIRLVYQNLSAVIGAQQLSGQHKFVRLQWKNKKRDR